MVSYKHDGILQAMDLSCLRVWEESVDKMKNVNIPVCRSDFKEMAFIMLINLD